MWGGQNIEDVRVILVQNKEISNGYFVCSTGDASMETIKKYIEEQG